MVNHATLETPCQFYFDETLASNTAAYIGPEIEQVILPSLYHWVRTLYPIKRRLPFSYPKHGKYWEYLALLSLIQIDQSSILHTPQFEIGTETVFGEVEISDEKMFSGLLANDFIVDMPPREAFSVKAKVVSVKRATPPIIEFEED